MVCVPTLLNSNKISRLTHTVWGPAAREQPWAALGERFLPFKWPLEFAKVEGYHVFWEPGGHDGPGEGSDFLWILRFPNPEIAGILKDYDYSH